MRARRLTVILAVRPSPTAASPGRGWISSGSYSAHSEALAVGAPRSPLLFGRRRGRALRPGQKILIRDFLPQIALTIPVAGALDPSSLFGAQARPIWVEIGFGGGEHLAAQAERHPEIGLIGCEIFENGIAKLLARIKSSGI